MKRKIVLLMMVCAMLSSCSKQTAQTTAGVENSSSTSSSTIESSLPESEVSSSSEASSETEKVYAVERIDLETNSFDGFVGDAVVITPAVYPTMVKDSVLTYSSTNESVVTVDENGSGTLTGVGSAEIVVTDEASGVEAHFSVTSQAVPQTSKPTGNAQQSGGQSQQGSQSQQQGSSQAQTPTGGGTQQKPSGGGATGGGTRGPNVGNEGAEQDRQQMLDATGGRAGNLAEVDDNMTPEERNEWAAGLQW